jgi:hypothetical protein
VEIVPTQGPEVTKAISWKTGLGILSIPQRNRDHGLNPVLNKVEPGNVVKWDVDKNSVTVHLSNKGISNDETSIAKIDSHRCEEHERTNDGSKNRKDHWGAHDEIGVEVAIPAAISTPAPDEEINDGKDRHEESSMS